MKNYQQIDFSELELDELVNYITDKHHAYCKQMLPLIYNHLQTVTTEAEKNDSGFKSVCKYFTDFTTKLEQHLRKEEHIFFPFIKKILDAKRNKESNPLSQVPLIENPLQILQTEHEKLISLLSIMRNDSHNYFAPEKSSAALKLCYSELYDFEKDFHKHIFMEENFLFPKILELEKSIKEPPERHTK